MKNIKGDDYFCKALYIFREFVNKSCRKEDNQNG